MIIPQIPTAYLEKKEKILKKRAREREREEREKAREAKAEAEKNSSL